MSSINTEYQETMEDNNGHGSFPLVNDFVNYYPWACGQFQAGVNIVINKMIHSEYVESSLPTGKYNQRKLRPKNPIRAHVSVMKIESQVEVPDRGTDSVFADDPIINITASCNLSDRLINLVFAKSYVTIPRQMIVVLAIIAKFHPHLTSITFKSKIDKYTIYELSKLVEVSTITEVHLDGCYVREGNYALLLGDKCSLKILSLARCSLTDTIVATIAEKLHYRCSAARELMILNLSSNRITDVGANLIAEALRSNRQLLHLNLAGNSITDKGASAIFDTMLDFPITKEERIAARGRRFKYLSDKMELVHELVSKITEEELDKLKRKSDKSTGIVVAQSKSKHTKPEILGKLTPHVLSRIHDRANFIAETTLGKFTDPFYPLTSKYDVEYCYGNNTLHSLNLAYNDLSVMSLRKVLKVILYQTILNRRPKGLMNLNIEGNPLPPCDELYRINTVMKMVSDEFRQGMAKPKRKSQYK